MPSKNHRIYIHVDPSFYRFLETKRQEWEKDLHRPFKSMREVTAFMVNSRAVSMRIRKLRIGVKRVKVK